MNHEGGHLSQWRNAYISDLIIAYNMQDGTRMLYKEVFPNFYGRIACKNNPIWTQEFDRQASQHLRHFLQMLEGEYVKAQTDMDGLQAMGKAFISDCLSAGQHADELLFNYWQFAGSTLLAYYFVNIKVPGYSFDWIANAITDSIQEEQERNFIVGRLVGFIAAQDDFICETLDEILCMWAYCLFSYARMHGGLKEVAQLFLQHYLAYFLRTPMRGDIYLDYVMALCQMYTYTKQHELEAEMEEVGRFLSIAYQATEIPREWKKIIAIEFSCINRNSGGLSREQWCAVVLDEYGDLLLGHEELQVLINACGSDPDRLIAQAPFIEQAALEYRAFIQKSSGNKSLVNYEYNEIYGILFPEIIVLLKRPQHAVALRWIGIFFGIPEDDLISGPLLQIVPNDLEGILLSEASRLTVIPRDPFAMVPDLTRRTNEFLGTTNTIRDELGFILELPLQQGIPAPELGHAYEAMLSDYFAFSDHWSSEQSSRLQGYVLHFGFNLPVQSIFHRQTGLSLPMIYSFQQPLAQRPIRKAFIWKGDSLYSGIECEGVKELLEGKGIEVVVADGETTTLEAFIQAYESNEYDLVWVSGHGDFQHLEPHKSSIQLFGDKILQLKDLSALRNSWENRRLLFLNICDGATTSLSNSPVSIGMTHYLVHKKQTLLSHLWPVYPLAAIFLGWIIAASIEKERSYADLFSEAVQTFASGKEAVLALLGRYTVQHDILDRIRNAEFDLSNFYYWGSLTLLQ